MADSLLQAMERMLDARIPADGRRAPRLNLMNLVLKILMEDMTVSEMVVVVAGWLVIMAKMEDELMDVVVAIEFILMMKNLITLITKRGLMRIPL